MKTIYIFKLFFGKTAKKYGSVIISILLAGIICFCIVSYIEKDLSEKATIGFYSEDAVYFTISCDSLFNIWQASLPSVSHISYLDGDIEEIRSEHIKYISFNPDYGEINLPPLKYEYFRQPTAFEWNNFSDICYAGCELQVRENPETGEKYYLCSAQNVYRVIGIMGFSKTSYLDTMLYVPFNGDIIPAAENNESGIVYAAEGKNYDAVLEDIKSLTDSGNINVKIVDKHNGGKPLLSRENFIIFFAGVSCILFAYVIYVWFCSLEKEIYILYLFGIQKSRIFIRRFIPLSVSVIIPYMLGIGAVFLKSPYYVQHYTLLWLAGFGALAVFLLFAAFMGAVKLSRLKDISGNIKKTVFL